MIGETWHVALAGIVLLATHFGLSGPALRRPLVRALGEGGFLAAYSAVAAVALGWLIWAYAVAPPGPILWQLYPLGHYAAVVLLPVALLLLVGGFSQPNPTAIGGGAADFEPKGILRLTRHPVMWGGGLWAIAHVLANGDLASVLFFAGLGILALAGTLVIDAKKARSAGVAFQVLRQGTSNLPFLAILQGRQSLARTVQELGIIRLALVVLAYGALLHLHGWLFGVLPYPG